MLGPSHFFLGRRRDGQSSVGSCGRARNLLGRAQLSSRRGSEQVVLFVGFVFVDESTAPTLGLLVYESFPLGAGSGGRKGFGTNVGLGCADDLDDVPLANSPQEEGFVTVVIAGVYGGFATRCQEGLAGKPFADARDFIGARSGNRLRPQVHARVGRFHRGTSHSIVAVLPSEASNKRFVLF